MNVKKELILLVVAGTILASAGSSFALTPYWTGNGSDNLWSTPENWWNNTLPSTVHNGRIDKDGATVLIDSSVDAESVIFYMGNTAVSGHTSTLNMTGGTYTGYHRTYIGQGAGNTSIVNISGGDWTNAKDFVLGEGGTGTANVSNGKLSAAVYMYLGGRDVAGNGSLNISGGTVTVAYLGAAALVSGGRYPDRRRYFECDLADLYW